jgi:hypothetical protein
VKAIHFLLGATLAAGLVASAVAQQPTPAPKGETPRPRAEQPKAQSGAPQPKPLETACQTPELDRYPRDELRPVKGKTPDLYIPVVPDASWGRLCKLSPQVSADSLQRS